MHIDPVLSVFRTFGYLNRILVSVALDVIGWDEFPTHIASHVKPWVFAAESAKLATLEKVAEQVEDGQLALEESMKLMGEVNHLSGRPVRLDTGEPALEGTPVEDDLWLAQASAVKVSKTSKLDVKSDTPRRKVEDVWTRLDGQLGLHMVGGGG